MPLDRAERVSRLGRLLRPKSIAVIGGGYWGRSVITSLRKFGFEGAIWPVHPTAKDICGIHTYRSVGALPGGPDACFVGVNRHATVSIVKELDRIGAGGAVCFASGFAETEDGKALQEKLIESAGDLVIMGPNCYGYVNALDKVALWPDQHGCVAVEKGVALLTQSSNIALNLTMQRRGLPLGCVATVGNQAQCGIAEIGAAMLDDPRISALGLHVEGFGDVAAWQALAQKARGLGKHVVVLKAGRTAVSQRATVSHTASLAGSAAGSDALLERLGFGQVDTLEGLIAALSLLDMTGPIGAGGIASLSCSGGEASLIADLAQSYCVSFSDMSEAQSARVRGVLGDAVTIANPLDYHTYIWGQTEVMTQAFVEMARGPQALTCVIGDFPRGDRCDPAAWQCLEDATCAAAATALAPVALVSSLAEGLDEARLARLRAAGVVPLCGLSAALEGIRGAMGCAVEPARSAVWALPVGRDEDTGAGQARLVSEPEAKAALARHGLSVPKGAFVDRAHLLAALRGDSPMEPAGPVPDLCDRNLAVKAVGLAHKTEHAGIVLNVRGPDALCCAIAGMPTESVYLEEMVDGAVAELLVGITRDPPHGFLLTLAAGGTFAELLDDRVSALLPVTAPDILSMLGKLRMYPRLTGYRGQPGANLHAIVDAVLAVQDYAGSVRDDLLELEINPLIATTTRALAADALIRLTDKDAS